MTNVRESQYRLYVPFGEPIYTFFYIIKLGGNTDTNQLLDEICRHMNLPNIYSLAFCCAEG